MQPDTDALNPRTSDGIRSKKHRVLSKELSVSVESSAPDEGDFAAGDDKTRDILQPPSQQQTEQVVLMEDGEPEIGSPRPNSMVTHEMDGDDANEEETPPPPGQQSSSPSSSRRRKNPLRRLYRRHLKSLSRAPSTPCILSFLIPLLSILTHAIFYYGQTAPMWHLHLSQQVELWGNATSYEAKTAFETMGLPKQNHYAAHQEKEVRTFTYWYAIQELWKGKNLPGKTIPRTAAVLLIVFSGIWPHLKLLLLNFTWILSSNQKRRTRMLQWLGTLGKWSLADVLVVCVMVGVLHLDWTVDPEAIRNGMYDNLPFILQIVKGIYSASDICTMALKDVDCHIKHKSWKRWSECKACVALVKSGLDHPETAKKTFKPIYEGVHMSGEGHITLRVLGTRGIYAFCTAVVLSILLSLLVDILDVRAQHFNSSSPQEDQMRTFLLPEGDADSRGSEDMDASNDDSSNEGDSYDMNEPDLIQRDYVGVDHDDMESRGDAAYNEFIESTTQPVSLFSHAWNYFTLAFCLVTISTVLAGISSHTMIREVHGAIPEVMEKMLAFVWDKPYSFFTLVQTTGAAGGYDYLLMSTFGLFVVAGPAIRSILCLIAWFFPAHKKGRQNLLAMIELAGAFCAWEVFVIAVAMVDMLMPAITSTVIMKPECAYVSEDGKCLEVNFNLQSSFRWIIIGGTFLVILSNFVYESARRPSRRSRERVGQLHEGHHYTSIGQGE